MKIIFSTLLIVFSIISFAQTEKTEAELLDYINDSLTVDGVIQSSKFLQLMKDPKLVGLDSMNLWIDTKLKSLRELIKKVDLFVVNDGEAQALTQEKNLIKAARQLRKMGPKWVVIKKGEHGVTFYCDHFMFSFPSYYIENVVDPTGAGDTFAGGLMGYLSKTRKTSQKILKEAVIYATTLASFNVEGFGIARTAPLTMLVVNKRRQELLKFISPY